MAKPTCHDADSPTSEATAHDSSSKLSADTTKYSAPQGSSSLATNLASRLWSHRHLPCGAPRPRVPFPASSNTWPIYPPRVPPDPTGYHKDIFRIPLRASLCRCPPSTPQEGGLHRQLLSLSHNPPSPSLGYLQVPSFASTVPSSQIPLPPQEPSF